MRGQIGRELISICGENIFMYIYIYMHMRKASRINLRLIYVQQFYDDCKKKIICMMHIC
jgi:hypothetical protein